MADSSAYHVLTFVPDLAIIGKRVVEFLLVLGVTADAIRAKIYRKSAISLKRGQFDTKFQVQGTFRTNHYCTDKRSAILHRKRPFCVFEPPVIRATYDDHLRLIGKTFY